MEKYANINKTWTENTGGNIMIDFILLNNGRIIAISEDATGIYESMEDFENGNAISLTEN